MNKREQIQEATASDEAISLSGYNAIVDACNRFNASYPDGASLDYQIEDKNGVHTVGSDYAPPTQTHSLFSIGLDKLGCSIGKCVRNTVSVELEVDEDYEDENWATLEVSEFTTEGSTLTAGEESLDVYVYLEYDNTDVTPTPDPEFEPEAFPYGVVIKADSDPAYVGINDVNATTPAFNINNFSTNKAISGKRRIIGIVNLTLSASSTYMIDRVIQAESQKGDWIDKFYMLDSQNTLSDNKGKRQSIEVNPCKDSPYYMKAQLTEINNCAANSTPSIPYFKADSQTQGDGATGATGGLKWAAVDSQYTPVPSDTADSKTIDITTDQATSHLPDDGRSWDADTNSYKVMSLHGVLDTPDNSKSLGYYDSTTEDASTTWTQGELKWASADSHFQDESGDSSEVYQESIEIAATANAASSGNVVQLYDFDDPLTTSEMDPADRVLVREHTGAEGGGARLRYIDSIDLAAWLDVTPSSEEVTIVTDVAWNASSHKLEQTKVTVSVLSVNSASEVTTDITTATDCP